MSMHVFNAIKKRKSVRRYSHKKPPWQKIVKAIDAARHAPRAGNQFVMKFILVEDEKTIQEIAASTQQGFVSSAQYLVVAVSDDAPLVRSYGERGTRYSSQQAGAAIQNFLLALTAQGLATSWIGYFIDEEVKRALHIPEGKTVEAIFPIGVETKLKTKDQKRVDLENIIYFWKWGNKEMTKRPRIRHENA